MIKRRSAINRFFPFHSKRMLDGARRTAASVVKEGLRSGLLKPGPCEVCGKKKTEAHHDDYAKPASVRWLCRTCHRAWHREHGTPYFAIRQQRKSNRRVFVDINKCAPVVGAITSLVEAALNREGVNHSDLARRLGSSRQMVSSWFAGGFRTIKALVSVADSIGYDVHVELRKREPNRQSKVA